LRVNHRGRIRRPRFAQVRLEVLESRALLSGLTASWRGQLGEDLVGLGPDVGPDGFIDAEISLGGLRTVAPITSVSIIATDGAAWAYGLNPQAVNNAEFVTNPGDSTEGTLYLDPAAAPNLAGQVLTLKVVYGDSSTDTATVVAGVVDSGLKAIPPPPIPIALGVISAEWKGQDGSNLGGAGAVRLSVSNLPAGRTVVAGMLSDPAGLSWAFGSSAGVALTTIDPSARPLAFRIGGDPTSADVGFAPDRDETGSVMTLRLILDDGSSVVATFTGGAADPGLRFPDIASTTYNAKPGDELHSIANNYGTVRLAAGTYNLDSPLILNHAVTIVGDPGAILLFSQPADSPAWTAAIKIHASNTTLEGFAVRFVGPIEWAPDISYGPAVIGATDNYDVGFYDPLVDLTFKNLDLESPPSSSSDWEEAVRLFRLTYAQSGVIEDNILKGGTTEFANGPWTILGNTYVGTPPNTFSYGVFVGHYTHDVRIAGNTINGTSDSSKTWRFAVLTQAGINDVVADNTVTGVGPRDDDTIANPNAPETILTEAYRLHFEGAPAAISPDGMVVQVPYIQGYLARTGDVVAILEGPDAGQWRMITQALGATSFLLDRPLNPLDSVISIATGFINLSVTGNVIDSRGSTGLVDIALAGNLYGTTVADNQTIGGRIAIWIYGSPTEAPNIWGWSHAPVMDLTLQNNLIVDSIDGAVINVEHGIYVKTNSGRVYMSGSVSGNLVVWSEDFLSQQAASGWDPTGFQIGNPQSIDPAEARLTLADNAYLVQPGQTRTPSFVVASATINGSATVAQSIPLSGEPEAVEGLRLVNDTGADSTDGVTSDGRLTFDPISSAFDYEYSLTGTDASYVPIAFLAGSTFMPSGLAEGMNTVFVRAVDRFGIVRGTASITLQYDSIKPDAPTGLRLVNDTGSSMRDRVTSDPSLTFTTAAMLGYEYSLSGADGSYLRVSLGPDMTFLPAGVAQGINTVFVRAVDATGIRSDAVAIVFTYDSTAPSVPTGFQLVVDSGFNSRDGLTNDGRVRLMPVWDAAWYEFSVSGVEGAYAPVSFGQGMTFLPAGLVQGTNTVFVRAVDAAGNRGAAARLSFGYDTVAPAAVPAISSRANGLVTFKPVKSGATYQYRIGGTSDYVDLGAATSFRVISGNRRPKIVWIRAIDDAGNIGPERGVVAHPMTLRAFVKLRRTLALKTRHAKLTLIHQ
jgi:hypothetical protein